MAGIAGRHRPAPLAGSGPPMKTPDWAARAAWSRLNVRVCSPARTIGLERSLSGLPDQRPLVAESGHRAASA